MLPLLTTPGGAQSRPTRGEDIRATAKEARMSGGRRAWALITLVLALPLLVGCADTGTTTTTTTSDDPLARQPIGGEYNGGVATGDTEAGAAFARWVLDQDPERRIITDAVVREERTLGVKVQPNVTKQNVQNLLVALTQGMARTFPNKDLQVIAFYQSGDKLAEADYDARTGQVDVQFLR